MIGKEEIRRIRESIGAKEGPILSLYVDVNPAKPENAGKGLRSPGQGRHEGP